MADSIRKLVFMNIVEVLQTVDSLKSAKPGRIEHSNQPLPAAGIIPLKEETEYLPDNNEQNNFDIAVRICVDEGDALAVYELFDVCADVQNAVMADPSRGGIADDTLRLGIDDKYADRDLPQAAADVLFRVVYQALANEAAMQTEDEST